MNSKLLEIKLKEIKLKEIRYKFLLFNINCASNLYMYIIFLNNGTYLKTRHFLFEI